MKPIIDFINFQLARLESALTDGTEKPLTFPPIFILGAPRSGSTLLYELMTEYFEIGYISNFHHIFYGWPGIIERIFRPFFWGKRLPTYTSKYGLIEGLAAPSESPNFWYRFFRRKPQYVPLRDADLVQMRRLRGAVRDLGDAFQKPVLFKNLPCALRLRPLGKIFPEAVFIVIRRDLYANACSILQARKSTNGNYDGWWSIEPPRLEEIRYLPPHEQAVDQIKDVYALIREDQSVVGGDRFIDIEYESLCADTEGTMRKISDFTGRRGMQFRKRNDIPGSFVCHPAASLDAWICKNLKQYIDHAAYEMTLNEK